MSTYLSGISEAFDQWWAVYIYRVFSLKNYIKWNVLERNQKPKHIYWLQLSTDGGMQLFSLYKEIYTFNKYITLQVYPLPSE